MDESIEDILARLEASCAAHWESARSQRPDALDLQFCARCGCHYSSPCSEHGPGERPAFLANAAGRR